MLRLRKETFSGEEVIVFCCYSLGSENGVSRVEMSFLQSPRRRVVFCNVVAYLRTPYASLPCKVFNVCFREVAGEGQSSIRIEVSRKDGSILYRAKLSFHAHSVKCVVRGICPTAQYFRTRMTLQ